MTEVCVDGWWRGAPDPEPEPAPAAPVLQDEPEDEGVCMECEGDGWVFSSYQEHPPNFEICPRCYNPENQTRP